MSTTIPQQKQLQSRCDLCGELNPSRYLQCGGCGARLGATGSIEQKLLNTPAAVSPSDVSPPATSPIIGQPAPNSLREVGLTSQNPPSEKTASLSNGNTSSVALWPVWATSDEQRFKSIVADLPQFSPTRWIIGADRRSGLAVDEGRQKLLVFEVVTGDAKAGESQKRKAKKGEEKPGKDVVRRQICSYSAIIHSEVIEDGEIIATSRNFSSSASRIGAASSFKVEMVALRLHLQGQAADSVIEVNFLTKAQERGNEKHKVALAKAHEWQKLLVTLAHLTTLMNRQMKALT